MHPAVIDCHACSPVAALVWYDWSLVAISGLLEAQAGVATHSFAAVLDALAELAQQRQIEPRQLWPTCPKVFGPAMRHARVEQHLSRSPASFGADIFCSPLGECAACAGACTAAAPPQQQAAVMADGSVPAQPSGQPLAPVGSQPSMQQPAALAAPSRLLAGTEQHATTVSPAGLPAGTQQAAAGDAEPTAAVAMLLLAAQGDAEAPPELGAPFSSSSGWSLLPKVSILRPQRIVR